MQNKGRDKSAETRRTLHTHTHTHTQLKRCRDFLCKLCLGAVLIFAPIFSFSATLPSGYTELEYIESTGTQYIDLDFGFYKTDEVEATFSISKDTPCDKYIVAPKQWDTGSNKFGLGQHCMPNDNYYPTFVLAYASANTRTTPLQPLKPLDGEIHTWVYKNFVASIPELEIEIDVSGITFGTTSTNLRLFYGYNAPTIGKIQYYKHTKNGFVIFEGVPAKRNSDNVVGLYDTVNGVFYTNSGTGTFIAGPEIVEETYTFLEYIDIDSDYIDTGLYLYTDAATNHYPNIHYTFMPLRYRTDSTMTNYVGARSPGLGGGLGLLLGSTDNFSYIDYFDGTRYSGSSGTGVQLNTKYEYDIVNRSATLKDVTNGTTLLLHTFGNSTERSDNSLTINALPGCGTGICTSNNKLRIYDFEVEGEAHMIPAKRDSDNAVGMYDTVRNKFCTVAGSGTITAGPAVAQPATVEIIWGGLAEPDASGMCVYGGTFTAPSTAPTAPSGLKFLGWIPR